MATKKTETAEIDVVEFKTGETSIAILGTSPLIFNRMAEKAKRELLLPRGRMTAAMKAQNIKHDPVREYRDSIYKRVADGPTRLMLPAPAFKGALCTAALDVPGAKKSQIGRLLWITGTHVDVYGLPQLFMTAVRSADMNRTPDIRTRAVVPEWACAVTIRYAMPAINAKTIANLLGASGLIVGVGDFRQERGKGNFGQFTLVDGDNETWRRIMEQGGRKAQDKALEDAVPFDHESEELLTWYNAEILRRGLKEAA